MKSGRGGKTDAVPYLLPLVAGVGRASLVLGVGESIELVKSSLCGETVHVAEVPLADLVGEAQSLIIDYFLPSSFPSAPRPPAGDRPLPGPKHRSTREVNAKDT